MPDRKIRLVYSATPSNKAHEQRNEWGFENARQLGLFEDFDKIDVIIIPVSDISSHLFRNVIDKRSPKLILDTRAFPDFFSLFPSTESALNEFNRRGIEYRRIPLSISHNEKTDWTDLVMLKSTISSYFQRRTGAPALVLFSNRKNLHSVAEKLQGYISQEIANTKFEEIPELNDNSNK